MTAKEMNLLGEYAKKCSKSLQDRVYWEISCRKMIMSCLIYGEGYAFYDEKTNKLGKYSESYNVNNPRHYKYAEFTEEELIQMYQEQKEEFEKGKCGFAGNDCEGVSYNYFQYADEL